MSPVTTVTFSDLFLGSVRLSLIKLGIQLFLFFATSGAIACAIRDTEWIDRQEDVLDELDVNRCIHLRMESVSRNVIADPLFALELFVLFLIIATATPMTQFPIYLLPAVL